MRSSACRQRGGQGLSRNGQYATFLGKWTALSRGAFTSNAQPGARLSYLQLFYLDLAFLRVSPQGYTCSHDTPKDIKGRAAVSPAPSSMSGTDGVKVNPKEGPVWAAGLQETLLTKEAAQTMDDTKGDAKAGLFGRHGSSGKPERLRG